MSISRPSVISLFSGAGGSTLGYDPAGCELIISFVKGRNTNDIQGVLVIVIFNATGLVGGLAIYDPDS